MRLIPSLIFPRRWSSGTALRAGGVVWLIVLCGACHDDSADRNAAQRSKWESKQPAQYVVEVCDSGFLPRQYCSESAVENGRVTAARTRLRTDAFWTGLDASKQHEPIAALFDAVDNAGECKVSVEYDDTYGYVKRLSVTCGEGTTSEVTCFAPDTTNLAACDSLASSGGAGGSG
jgi:hypothetical protein